MHKSVRLVLGALVTIVTACGTSEVKDEIEQQQSAVSVLQEGKPMAGMAGSTIAPKQLPVGNAHNPFASVDIGGMDNATVGPVIEQSAGAWPARCSPRPCIAMCVTCEYDICLRSGESIEACDADRELCKKNCASRLR